MLFSALCFSSYSNAQTVTVPVTNGISVTVSTGSSGALQDLKNNPAATNVTMPDDANVNVPLPFNFPYYGQNFNNSWMHSNGVVSFQHPNITGNFCCSGVDLTNNTNTAYNYSIMPLWTDLIAYRGGSHYILGTETSMTYGWYGVSEYGRDQNRSSFEVKIDNTGLVDVKFSGAIINAHSVTSGMTGDLSKGEYYQYYHGNNVNWGPTQWTSYGVDQCISNPLSSPNCSGYAEAYFTQQCSINPLYNVGCPGYEQAYFSQQCGNNPLYNSACPGYAQAYLQQQCSGNQLYSNQCPGYQEAYAKKLASELQKEETTVTVQVTTPTSTTTATVDSTSTSGQVTVDLGGATISTTGEIKVADGVPEVVKETQTQATTAVSQEQEKRTVALNPSAFAIAKRAVAEAQAIAMSVVAESINQSLSESANPSDGMGIPSSDFTGAGIKLHSVTIEQVVDGKSEQTQVIAYVPPALSIYRQEQTQSYAVQQQDTGYSNFTTNSSFVQQEETLVVQFKPIQQEEPKVLASNVERLDDRTPMPMMVEEQKQDVGSTVKSKADNNELAGGVDIRNVATLPVGYDKYLSASIKDTSFYKPEQIYRNQKTVDNERVLRQLNGRSDIIHNNMVEQQYK